MGQDFFDLPVEAVAVDHDDVSAAEAPDFDVGAHPNDLETPGMGGAGMGFFHLDLVKEAI
jgi:hypothetical protein